VQQSSVQQSSVQLSVQLSSVQLSVRLSSVQLSVQQSSVQPSSVQRSSVQRLLALPLFDHYIRTKQLQGRMLLKTSLVFSSFPSI
jgi:hypothetical protein